jgi:hypothetical protein
LAEGLQLFGEGCVPQGWIPNLGRKLKKIGEQAVENAELILKRILAVFRQRGSVSEELRETLTASGSFEDTKRLFAGLSGGFDVHFDGATGAAFGELSSELDLRRLSGSFFFEDFLHFGLRQRREMELEAA